MHASILFLEDEVLQLRGTSLARKNPGNDEKYLPQQGGHNPILLAGSIAPVGCTVAV